MIIDTLIKVHEIFITFLTSFKSIYVKFGCLIVTEKRVTFFFPSWDSPSQVYMQFEIPAVMDRFND